MVECKFCKRQLKNNSGLVVHEKHCKQNPNYVKRVRSPNAGAQPGCVPWNKGKKLGRAKHWDDKYPREIYFCENSSMPRHSVKKILIRENIIEYICSCCGIGPFWNGNKMPLILDHINGINNDNRIENLRFVCSNCDSQLPTYKSRNRK